MNNNIHGKLTVGSERFAIVVSRYNEFVTGKLLSGAIDAFKRHGAADDQLTEVWVPGTWELALSAKALIESGRFAGIVCLGAVIRGQTTHHEHIGAQAARTIAQLALDHGVPVSFGVLTTDTLEQAVERAGAKSGNKGADAALSCIEMVSVLQQVRALARKK